MKTIYISHPYGGDFMNEIKADTVRKELKRKYPDVCFVNPLGMFGDEKTDYIEALSDALELLSRCDGMVSCDGWEDSVGCKAEIAFCKQKGIPYHHVDFVGELLK